MRISLQSRLRVMHHLPRGPFIYSLSHSLRVSYMCRYAYTYVRTWKSGHTDASSVTHVWIVYACGRKRADRRKRETNVYNTHHIRHQTCSQNLPFVSAETLRSHLLSRLLSLSSKYYTLSHSRAPIFCISFASRPVHLHTYCSHRKFADVLYTLHPLYASIHIYIYIVHTYIYTSIVGPTTFNSTRKQLRAAATALSGTLARIDPHALRLLLCVHAARCRSTTRASSFLRWWKKKKKVEGCIPCKLFLRSFIVFRPLERERYSPRIRYIFDNAGAFKFLPCAGARTFVWEWKKVDFYFATPCARARSVCVFHIILGQSRSVYKSRRSQLLHSGSVCGSDRVVKYIEYVTIYM